MTSGGDTAQSSNEKDLAPQELPSVVSITPFSRADLRRLGNRRIVVFM